MPQNVALFSAYVALLKVLHKNKVIDINDVVAEFGGTIDFAKIQHMDKDADQSANVVLYEHLQQISLALLQSELKIQEAKSRGQGKP